MHAYTAICNALLISLGVLRLPFSVLLVPLAALGRFVDLLENWTSRFAAFATKHVNI